MGVGVIPAPDELYQPILAFGIDPAPSADAGLVLMPGVHKAHPVSTLPDQPLPLCWVAEGKQRGATDDEWAVAFDHESLPAVWVHHDPEFVSCSECREWMHA